MSSPEEVKAHGGAHTIHMDATTNMEDGSNTQTNGKDDAIMVEVNSGGAKPWWRWDIPGPNRAGAEQQQSRLPSKAVNTQAFTAALQLLVAVIAVWLV